MPGRASAYCWAAWMRFWNAHSNPLSGIAQTSGVATFGTATGLWLVDGGVVELGVVEVEVAGGSAVTAVPHAVRASAHATRIGRSMSRTLGGSSAHVDRRTPTVRSARFVDQVKDI